MKININPDLEVYRQQMLDKIDQEAEVFRHRFITPGSGQAMVYLVKEQEARALLANPPNITPSAPHIAAEAQARGITVAAAAQLVIDEAESWRALSAKIEGQRQTSKLAIGAATTVAEVHSASSPDWEGLLTA